jgi:DNA helicase HerA-like ATPase
MMSGAPTRTVGWSVDGEAFECSGPVGDGLPLGGYVRLHLPDGTQRVGQLLEQVVARTGSGRRVDAAGVLLDGVGDTRAFDEAIVGPAGDDDVRRALSGARNTLEVGSVRGRDAVPAMLAARGFNRHTFLCGQSGSGKTYSLGVLLERLLMRTTLPLLVLDPNGDHVHLGEPAVDVPPDTAAAYRAATDGLRVLRAGPDGQEESLRIRLGELGMAAAGALLELDPVVDREEFNALVHTAQRIPTQTWGSVREVMEAMRGLGGASVAALLLRMENLGIDGMSVWALGHHGTLMDRWAQRPRALVADTSGFASRRERLAVAVSVLAGAWERRMQRRPFLLVVDEAHDVCPAEPADRLQAVAVELFTRIAGEGRKYGIHLLLASQRPDKLPDNVLSQCDNLVLMRVNSAGDRHALAARFGFAPTGLVELAGRFGLGEALVAGKIADPPALVRIGRRLTPEGGGDVPTDWADTPADA